MIRRWKGGEEEIKGEGGKRKEDAINSARSIWYKRQCKADRVSYTRDLTMRSKTKKKQKGTKKKSPLPLGTLENQAANNASSNSQTADNGHTDQALPGNLVVNQALEALGLQIVLLQIEQQLVVASGLGVIAQLVVAEGEVVEAFAAAVGRGAEDFGEQAHAFLLLGALCGFNQTLVNREEGRGQQEVGGGRWAVGGGMFWRGKGDGRRRKAVCVYIYICTHA